MKAVSSLAAAVVLVAGQAFAGPLPQEGVYVPGPEGYGEVLTTSADRVFSERELNALHLSPEASVTVTRGVSPAVSGALPRER